MKTNKSQPIKMTAAEIGRRGEKEAARLLKKKKYKILLQNLHLSHNEIDIIAASKRERLILFVEVKTRTVNADLYSPFGSPASAVTKDKQNRTITAARDFLRKNPKFSDYQPRLDVIEVYVDKTTFDTVKINHIENAFGV